MLLEVAAFAEKRPVCSIVWTHEEVLAQDVDNWVRFVIDILTLFLIVGVGSYIGAKRVRDLRYVQIQLFLMLLSQLLYCTRSSARIVVNDRSYFGNSLPSWTYTCNQVANIVSLTQHWIYTLVYFDAALVSRLYFASDSSERRAAIKSKEARLARVNGVAYVILFLVLIANLIFDLDLVQTLSFSIFSVFMASLLCVSMRRLMRLLQTLGTPYHEKTIMAQLAFLVLIALLDLIAWVEKIRFLKDCHDNMPAPSPAGTVSRTFTLCALFCWRMVTVLTCVFFVGHARPLSAIEQQEITRALNLAVCA